MNPRDLFISHSSGDAEIARALRAELEAAGYSCWMAPDDIVGTETWTEQILNAIGSSKAMLVLVSTAANKSPHVSREVNLALGRGRAVLPIRIEPVPPEGSLEYLLSLVQRVDAFPPPISNHSAKILKRLESIVGRVDADAETKAHEAPSPAGGKDAAAPGGTEPARPEVEPKPEAATIPSVPGPIGPGSVVGAFTIESLLGEGGMATVYRARQDEPKRGVALKVIRSDHAADASYRARFMAEKETLAALEHPSIVPIYAAGDAAGVLYIAMRLVDGPDLQARIKTQGRLSLRETVQVLGPVSDAIDYAHSMGVIHRDLKPSNIILDRAGRPYLTDFGLGKQLQSNTQVSVPGLALGTLDYMAPEQFTGATDASVAPAIDTYALGCVAFACLTGQPPFVRDTPEQLMYAHAHEAPPSIRSIRPEYPEQLDAAFARVLSKDPKARFGSAREFVMALDAVIQAGAAGQTRPVVIPTETSSAAKARRWIATHTAIAVGGAALALVAVVAVTAGMVFSPGASSRPTEIARISPTPLVTAPPTLAPTPVPPTPTPAVGAGTFPNADEQQLMDLLPASVSVTSCVREENPYKGALAMVRCLGPADAVKGVFYALYADPAAMTTDYTDVLGTVGLGSGTTTGCFDLVKSNNGWSYKDGGASAPTEGQLACYPRSEGTFDGIQYLWTYDALNVMGLWLSPGYQQGLDYFDAWVTDARV